SDSGPNYSYSWQNEDYEEVGNSLSVVVDEIGVYTLIVTNNATGCSAASTVEVISTVTLPTAYAGEDALLTCTITETLLDGTGSSGGSGITYQWLDPNLQPISTTITATADEPGTYTLIVTNTDNGCVSQAEVFVD